MRQISNSDYDTAVRLLAAFSVSSGLTVREKEDRRRAGLLCRKLEKRKEKWTDG